MRYRTKGLTVYFSIDSGDYSNHIPVIYKVTLGTSTFSLVSYNLGFFDVPGASRLDFPRPSGKDIVDSEVLNGNVFVEPKLWTNQTNRLRDYLQNFDILLTQEEIPTIRARSEKPFIQGFEYTNMDGNFKGVYAKKNFANIQPGGVSTCSTLFYTWTGAGNLADATVDTDPDAVEEADMAAWNGQKRFNAKPSLLVCGFWGLSTPGVVSANDQPFIVVNVQDRAQYAPLSTTATYKFSPDSQAKLRETLYGICVQMKAQSGRSTLNCGLAETLEQKVPIIFLVC
ncbi:hypothetical protein DFS34DRAFT_482353 [Phlyctochytrium arcticum]|nr:hypothetical protein DFS34DRAFT_482353 [Phlyctochytrium arcticum]